MKARVLCTLALVIGAAGLLRGTAVQADEKEPAKKVIDAARQAAQDEAGKMVDQAKEKLAGKPESAESGQAEMMEMLAKLGAPGEYHQHLEPMVGRWKAAVKMRWDENSEWEESTGIMENKWHLGGRWLLSQFKGDMSGEPFEGTGYMGYDNVKKEYVSIWMDTMCTGVMVCTGSCDASHRVFTLKGESPDPMTNQPWKFRNVCTIVDANKHTFEMFATGADGKEYLMMEITYTRT